MNKEERIAAIVFLRTAKVGDPGCPTTVSECQQYLDRVMERPTWTHEIAYPDSLIAEIERGTPADMTEIIEKIPAEKRVIVVMGE